MSNLQFRFLSSIVIALSFIITIFVYRPLFDPIIYIIAVFMLLEWYKMTNSSRFYTILGLVVIPPSIISLFMISQYDEKGWFLFSYFLIIWTVDTMAMVGGKALKGPKLCSKLSPNKTISGLFVGVVCAVMVIILLSLIPQYVLPYDISEGVYFYTFCSILAFVAQLRDVFISYFKRKFKTKDTGTIIPGHGGMLDRFDSIILTAPLMLIYIKISSAI